MPEDELVALPRISYTSLDFETIVEDVKRIITENPEYNQNWEDYLASNAGKMIIELCSYITDLLALRVDWMVNENYLSTATQSQSIVKLLRLINYRLTLSSTSMAKIDTVLSEWVLAFDLPALYSLQGTDRAGNPINLELINKDDDGENIYFGDDALVTLETGTISNPVISFTGNDALLFYAGTTQTQNEFLIGIDNESIVLERNPVIEGSIQIWTLNGTGEEVEKIPLVSGFVAEEAQETEDGSALTVPPYMIESNTEGQVTVKFGSAALVNIFNEGDAIRIYYRIGGGIDSNIIRGSINIIRPFVVGGTPIQVQFTNNEAATGGTAPQTISEARREAPLYITTSGKTVTPADYRRILSTYSTVFKVAAYGKVNEPAEIFDEYGYTIPTYETWIYVVPFHTDWATLSVRDDYNTVLQISKPYEIQTDTISFPAPNTLTGTISFDPGTETPKKVTGAGTLFTAELEAGDVIAIAGTGTGSEIFVGVVDYTETGSNDVLYLIDAPLFTASAQTFSISTHRAQLPSSYVPIYKRFPAITITGGIVNYIQKIDYEVDYDKGIITRYTPGFGFGMPETTTLNVTWWWHDQTVDAASDITVFEAFLRNKKMLCINNVYRDTLYTGFDIQGIVYVEKSYNQQLVKESVEAYVFLKYSLPNRNYNTPVRLPEIIADVQAIAGVRYVDVRYFGKDYATYKLDPENAVGDAANLGLTAIGCKYNEILLLSTNEFEGETISPEYQSHGIVFDYTEVPS